MIALGFAALAPSDRGVAQSVALGDENSWLRIQNVGVDPALIEIDFHNADGSLEATDGCPQEGVCDALRAGSGRSFFQQTLDDLSPGYRGSGFVTSDQPFTALLARDVIRPDGTFQIAGDSLLLGGGVPEHYLPWVVNDEEHVSRIVVENTSEDLAACVEIVYYSQGSLSEGVTDPPSPSAGCPDGGVLVGPRATLLRDEDSIGAPFGFDGSARVRTYRTSSGVDADGQELSVVVDTRARESAGLSSYRGITAAEASQVVLLPLVDRNSSQGQSTFTTRFRIMNASPSQPNEVTLLFAGVDASGAEVEFETTMTVDGATTCDQWLSECLPEDKTLPPTFVGTVRMQAVHPIAVVAQRVSTDGSLADYRGFSGGEASTQVVMPVVDKNYGPFGDNRGWNSWFRVMAFDGSEANVYVVYYGSQFPDGLFPQSSVQAHAGGRTFRQWEDPRLPDGWVGSAVVVADRPVVVVANLESDVFHGDPVMLYNAIPLE